MKTYDEELADFIRDMEEEDRAGMFKREAALPLNGRLFDSLTEEDFLTYLHGRTSRYLSETYAGNTQAAAVIGMQCLFDLARRKRNLAPNTDDDGRYDLGNLETLRNRPGAVE